MTTTSEPAPGAGRPGVVIGCRGFLAARVVAHQLYAVDRRAGGEPGRRTETAQCHVGALAFGFPSLPPPGPGLPVALSFT